MANIRYIGKSLLIEENGKRVLAFGDLHFGFEESLNNCGILALREMFNEFILDFNKIFDETGKVDEIILLGDIKHGFGKGTGQEWNDVLNLFDYLREKCGKIIIVKGNHDNYLKNIASRKKIKVVDYYVFDKYCFVHGDKDFKEIWNKKIKFLIAGHAHPAIWLADKEEIRNEKYKCFLNGKYRGKEMIILPSFFNYNAGSDVLNCKINLVWDIDIEKFNVCIVEEKKLKTLDFGNLGDVGE